MSDDLKQKLINAGVAGIISALLAVGGVEKSETHADSDAGGHSWLALDLSNHTARMDYLQAQIDELKKEQATK